MSEPVKGAELTDNELAVLQRAAHGDTYAVIAQDLGYTEKSVSKMALRLARKLGARNISHAVHLATVARLIGTSPDCGSRAAYLRHLRRGEEPCVPCRAANARHAVAQRAGQLSKEASR